MKHVARILSLLFLVSAGLFYTGCDKGEGNKKTEEQTQLEKLVSTWNLTSATLDGQTRTADFNNLKLTLTGTYTQDGATYQYSFTGSRPNPSPWPANGSWKFGNPPSSKIIRLNDNVTIDYAVAETQLTLSFNCASCDFAGGRVNGDWVFVFSK